MNAPEIKAVLGMTADTIGKDLLSAIVQEIRLLPVENGIAGKVMAAA